MSLKNITILTCSALLLLSCGKSAKSNSANAESAQIGAPCNVKIVVTGKAPNVHFNLYSKAKEKVVTIDKEVNLLDDKADVFSISSYLGGKIKTSLKTKDSFGPNVKVEVFVNGVLWRSLEDSYHPIIEGELPTSF